MNQGEQDNESFESDESDNDWLFGGYHEEDDDGSVYEATETSVCSCENLNQVMSHLRQTGGDYRERTRLVKTYMGSMALCRGEGGELLRQAGANEALLSILSELSNLILPMDETEDSDIITLATACWGAIRDLACGNASNRLAVRESSGLQLLANYLLFYDGIPWNHISSNHLRLLTNIIGALRNVTHSSPANSVELHELGVTRLLTWRLLLLDHLPPPGQPWREAAFRAACVLVNMSEKSTECARACGSNPPLIKILLECRGGVLDGSKTVYMHLGLQQILACAKQELDPESFDEEWNVLLLKEKERKKAAQQREQERKQQLKG